MKLVHILAAGALVLPAVAIAQTAPGDQPTTSAKAKKGKKHHDAMSAPDAAPADTMAPPSSTPPATTTPSTDTTTAPPSASDPAAPATAPTTPPHI